MGAKRVLHAYQIVGGTTGVSGTMTGTTAITAVATNIANLDNIGFQISWTGTPNGTFQVQCSIDGTNFYPLTFDPALTAPAGAAGSFLINLTLLPFPWIRLVYTNASGTGALTAWISGKDVN